MSNVSDRSNSSFPLSRTSRQLDSHLQEKNSSPSDSFESCNPDRAHPEFCTPLTFIEASIPNAAPDRRISRTVRSHAIGTALARKRFEEQKRGSNFRLQKIPAHDCNPNIKQLNSNVPVTPELPRPFGVSSIDPFETLSVDAQRLTDLFHLRTSLRAGEPVFNINDAIHYQSLQSIFETGLSDGALAAAISLTLAYAASNWRTTNECVKFSSIAMHQLRQKLTDPLKSSPSATIGTILLLLGNAYRIGELQSAKSHLNGLESLLTLCHQRHVRLPAELRRAIYWQDLFSSIFLGTDRIVNYEGFYPGQDLVINDARRDACLPVGFARSAHLLNSDILAAAGDVASLYADRQHWIEKKHLAEGLDGLDNLQARLEGRLHALRQATDDDLLLSCVIALLLCVYGFWDGIWNSALIPRELSTKLLHHLRCCHQYDFGKDDLFLWLVYVGRAFAVDASVRNGLDELWLGQQHKADNSTFPPWDEARRILSTFIWSDVLFTENEANGWFWERIGE